MYYDWGILCIGLLCLLVEEYYNGLVLRGNWNKFEDNVSVWKKKNICGLYRIYDINIFSVK